LPRRKTAVAAAGASAAPAVPVKGAGPVGRTQPAGRAKSRGKKTREEDVRFKKVRDWWAEILKNAKKK